MQKNSSKKLLISQSDNYTFNFGEIYRSSAIFWAKCDKTIKTTISITNYWKYKNNLDVSILINSRDMKGRLLSRKVISFENSDVYNHTPDEDFEGSIEIEAFCNKNLRIPYAAIMAIYESEDSISMVHSYTRVYSQIEIEDRRTITLGEESCWSIRDDDEHESFCVFHNGSTAMPAQTITLSVRNYHGEEMVENICIDTISPFETVIIKPQNYLEGLSEWLAEKPGECST